MTREELRELGDRDLVRKLMNLRPSVEAAAFIAAVISDPDAVQAVGELRRRYQTTMTESSTTPRTRMGHHPSGTSVSIEPERFRAFFYRRRTPLMAVGPMFGRCKGWASVVVTKGTAGFWALDELANAMGIHVDDLIKEVCAPSEYDRLFVE
jgi:hypothetical protein